MQVKSNLIRIKRKTLLYLVVIILTLGIATPVLADYLGPDRTTTESYADTYDYGVWARALKYAGECKKPNGDDAAACIVCTWERNPGNACGDAEYSYALGTKSKVVTKTINLDPATINGSLQSCTLNNGWCNTVPEFSLNGYEPISGYNILAIEGSLNGQTFACSGTNCNIPLNEGDNSFTFWALSSYGDSSTMGSFNAKVDTVSPNVGLDVSGSGGLNSWYVSPTIITATGSDSTSGLLSALLSVNNGASESSTTLNEGIHNISVQAEDNAGNISNSSTTISVDTTTPFIDISATGTTGNNPSTGLGTSGWYISNMEVTATANDATSGIGTLEVSSDGSAYRAYTSPVLFSDGHHTLQFKATDNAGNQTETAVQEFFVDTTAPAIDIPKSWDAGKTITYNVQDGGSGLSVLRVVIEDEDEKYAKVAWDENVSGNKFNGDISWDGKFADKTIAPPGEYLVWIKASDKAGNEYFGLGKVIVPDLNLIFSLFKADTTFQGIPIPPKELSEPIDSIITPPDITNSIASTRSTLTSLGIGFGGSKTETKGVTKNSFSLSSGTASSSTTTTPSNVLWGATAAAVIGAATTYALDEKRKRKEAEAKQLAEAQAKAAKLNAPEEQRKIVAAWLESQAILNAQPAPTQNASYQAHMEEKMERIDAEEDAKWEASQAVIQKRAEEQKQDEKSRAADSARWAGLASQGQYAANVPAPKEKNWWQKLLDAGKKVVTTAQNIITTTVTTAQKTYEEVKKDIKQKWEDTKQWANTNIVQPAKDAVNKAKTTAQNFVTTTVTTVKETYETIKNDPVKWVERKIDQTWPALRATGPGKNGISIVNDIDNKTIINMVVSSFNNLVKSIGGFPYQYEKKPDKFEQRTHSVTIHPTSIAISLSLQGEAPRFVDTLQWMLSPLGKLFQIGILNSPSYGMAQIGPDKYDLIKQNIQLYTNLDGVSDIPFFALSKPQVSTAAMIERVAPAVEVCQEYSCKPTDREIVIALSQNGDGFNAENLKEILKSDRYKSDNSVTVIDWQSYFNNQKAFTSDKGAYRYYFLNWRASNHNFDTWFMLNRYYNNAMAFEASGDWSMPQGVDWEYINSLMENTSPSGQE